MTKRFLPIGIQDFEKLRKGNFVYVDKTKFIYELAQTSSPYFLSRPRRFGKSLLLSTMEYYFQGKKELFHGLAIEKLESEMNVAVWKDNTGKVKDSVTGTSSTTNTPNGYNSTSYGFVWGNGTNNAVMGYAIKVNSNTDAIETAQMK